MTSPCSAVSAIDGDCHSILHMSPPIKPISSIVSNLHAEAVENREGSECIHTKEAELDSTDEFTLPTFMIIH